MLLKAVSLRRFATYPFLFVGGWLFNFIVDIKFFAGFLSGWISHGWVGEMMEWLGV